MVKSLFMVHCGAPKITKLAYINPITMLISTINNSYWIYTPTLLSSVRWVWLVLVVLVSLKLYGQHLPVAAVMTLGFVPRFQSWEALAIYTPASHLQFIFPTAFPMGSPHLFFYVYPRVHDQPTRGEIAEISRKADGYKIATCQANPRLITSDISNHEYVTNVIRYKGTIMR